MKFSHAFTLIEILSVIALMMLIVGGGVAVWSEARNASMRSQTKAKLATVAAEIEAAKLNAGNYPGAVDEKDAWGNDLMYSKTSTGFILTSKGADLNNSNDDIVYDSAK